MRRMHGLQNNRHQRKRDEQQHRQTCRQEEPEKGGVFHSRLSEDNTGRGNPLPDKCQTSYRKPFSLAAAM